MRGDDIQNKAEVVGDKMENKRKPTKLENILGTVTWASCLTGAVAYFANAKSVTDVCVYIAPLGLVSFLGLIGYNSHRIKNNQNPI